MYGQDTQNCVLVIIMLVITTIPLVSTKSIVTLVTLDCDTWYDMVFSQNTRRYRNGSSELH